MKSVGYGPWSHSVSPKLPEECTVHLCAGCLWQREVNTVSASMERGQVSTREMLSFRFE